MYCKVALTILAVVAVAKAGVLSSLGGGGHGGALSAGAQLAGLSHDDNHVDYYAYPKYQYSYGVQDLHTGDYKTQQESRDGDVVKGSYTVLDADGTIRTVQYTADKHSGFNAIVTRTGKASHSTDGYH